MKADIKYKGISLIILVITMIVMIILATATAMIITNDNPIDRAKKVKLQNDLSAIRENVQLYINKKYNETNGAFKKEQLTADKNGFTYSDENGDKTDSFLDIIGEEYESYKDKVWIEKGVLIYLIQEEKEQKWAEEIGIQVLSVLIDKNGRLLCVYDVSSLIDNDGVLRIPSMVKTITQGAFSAINMEIKKIIIPGTCKVIEQNAFYGQKEVEEIIIEDGVNSIGDYAFQNCFKLKSISLPDSITKMGNYVFFACSNLETAKISGGLDKIPTGTFYNCNALKTVEIPDSITKIESLAFTSCTSLETLNISKYVTYMADALFTDCKNLILTIDKDNPSYKIDGDILSTKDGKKILQIFRADTLTEFRVPEGMETLSAIFGQCKSLKKIYIPKSVKTISTNAFVWVSTLNYIEVDEENPNFSSDEEALYNKNKTQLICYFAKNSSYTVKDTVKTLKQYSIGSINNLTSLTLPDTLERIESQAIYRCYNLLTIYLPENINYIHPIGIYDMSVNLKVTMSSSNKTYTVEDNILFNKDKTTLVHWFGNETTLDIPSGVTTIGDLAFHAASRLKTVNIPNTVTTIGGSFNYCYSLTSITIPTSVVSIAKSCFYQSTKINEIIIQRKKGQAEIADAPWNCSAGTKVIKYVIVE